jgi:hypothetical protein
VVVEDLGDLSIQCCQPGPGGKCVASEFSYKSGRAGFAGNSDLLGSCGCER